VTAPVWLAYSFATGMLLVTVYCIVALVLTPVLKRRNHYDVSIAHILMGVAMSGMLVPAWSVLPATLWEMVFAAVALYFLALAVRSFGPRRTSGGYNNRYYQPSHYLTHALLGGGMVYMLWLSMPATQVTPAMTGMPMLDATPRVGATGSTFIILGLVLASAIWQLDGINRSTASAHVVLAGDGSIGTGRDQRRWFAPRLEVCCHIAMCLTMGYMLVLAV
jgi:Domain of unknown function (DUF5134)